MPVSRNVVLRWVFFLQWTRITVLCVGQTNVLDFFFLFFVGTLSCWLFHAIAACQRPFAAFGWCIGSSTSGIPWHSSISSSTSSRPMTLSLDLRFKSRMDYPNTVRRWCYTAARRQGSAGSTPYHYFAGVSLCYSRSRLARSIAYHYFSLSSSLHSQNRQRKQTRDDSKTKSVATL